MGPDIELRGYFHGYGFNSAGIMNAGGCGNELAKWIIKGQPDLDMWSFDIRYGTFVHLYIYIYDTLFFVCSIQT